MSDDWPGILKVCRYFLTNPRPQLYPRQLPIGVHSKFIDQNHAILRDVLDFLLGDHVNKLADAFGGRFHLLEPEPQIRMRFLDESLQQSLGFPVIDLAVPYSEAQELKVANCRCLVVENLMIFLTLPRLPKTIAIFGGGKAAALLTGLRWLQKCQNFYWGDMDDAGFRILSNLRQNGLSVKSVFMDEKTWSFFSHLAHPGSVEPGSLDVALHPTELSVWKLVREES